MINYTGGIYVDNTTFSDYNHDVSIVGWGEDQGVKYWLIRNSWGSYWGEQGLFKLIRGVNNTGIEGYCSYAIPLDTWTNDERNTTNPGPEETKKVKKGFFKNYRFNEVVKSSVP